MKENPTISRQAEVDAQIQSLVEAVAGLTVAETPVEYADLTELNDAIAKAEKVNPEGYTSESLASMNNLLKAARELAASKPEKSLESTVSTVKNALLAAMSGLVKVEVPSEKQYADLTALNKEIGKAKAVRTDSYTEKSVNAMKTVLTAAQELAASKPEKSLQSTVDTTTRHCVQL